MEFKLICNSFTHTLYGHTGYSVHGKISKYIKWIHDGHTEQKLTFDKLEPGDKTFYVDSFLPWGLNDNTSEIKYGMIMECSDLVGGVIDDVINNLDHYMNEFETIFTWNEHLCSLHERIKWIPGQGSWIKEPQIYEKNKLVSIISSNKSSLPGHRERLSIIEKLKDKAPLFGNGFNPVEFKEEALSEYMFSVAIENKNDWFTEKILDCFMTGTIPVYRGTPNIGKWFNMDGIIILDDTFDMSNLNEDLYYSKMEAVKDNLERAKKMEILEDYIYENYLSKT